jgi:hypothetical protein
MPLTNEDVRQISRTLGDYYGRICELETELKAMRRLFDVTGRRMAKQREHITDLIAMLIAKNGGTRRERAKRMLHGEDPDRTRAVFGPEIP